MMLAFGSFVVRVARSGYSAHMPLSEVDDLDAIFEKADERLWNELELWLQSCSEPWLKWQFHRHNNNHNGVLQFSTSRNHRSSQAWELLQWLAKTSQGTYGLLYIHDDEDIGGLTHYGRGNTSYENVFRVWSLKHGKVSEHADPFLSPIVQEGEDYGR